MTTATHASIRGPNGECPLCWAAVDGRFAVGSILNATLIPCGHPDVIVEVWRRP